MKYKLTISYDGTRFGGWQFQLNSLTIQELIEQALTTALRAPMKVTGAGRTDAGVHARGQVAHFDTPSLVDEYRLRVSLNGILPPEIRIQKVENVPDAFHARFGAVRKEYHYHLFLEPVLDPFRRLYVTHILYPIDISRLKQAATLFLGTHDFGAFTNARSHQKNTIRTINRLDVIEQEGGFRLEFEGKSFLYKMVRNITGALLTVASGKITIEALAQIFKGGDRTKAPSVAPPQGLFLMKIEYPQVSENEQSQRANDPSEGGQDDRSEEEE